MSTSIFLVRHGVTEWNYAGRVQGRSDIPLAPEGERQAEAAAARLADERWDAIYSSPLQRACQTAQAIARRTGQAPVMIDGRLTERNMGEAEGLFDVDLPVLWPGVAWDEIPGMEPVAAVAARAHAALTEMANRHPGGRVVCVAHGSLIRAFLRSIGAGPTVDTRTVSITTVNHDGRAFVQKGAPDHRHLLQDGVEYSGEKGRVAAGELEPLLRRWGPGAASPEPVAWGGAALEPVIWGATAIESARVDGRLVGFARAFTDGALYGCIDLAVALSGYEHVRSVLIDRLKRRYPAVPFTVLANSAQVICEKRPGVRSPLL